MTHIYWRKPLPFFNSILTPQQIKFKFQIDFFSPISFVKFPLIILLKSTLGWLPNYDFCLICFVLAHWYFCPGDSTTWAGILAPGRREKLLHALFGWPGLSPVTSSPDTPESSGHSNLTNRHRTLKEIGLNHLTNCVGRLKSTTGGIIISTNARTLSQCLWQWLDAFGRKISEGKEKLGDIFISWWDNCVVRIKLSTACSGIHIHTDSDDSIASGRMTDHGTEKSQPVIVYDHSVLTVSSSYCFHHQP
jgi:hypothetical protein